MGAHIRGLEGRMTSELTDQQKQLIRWIVQKVRGGELAEVFVVQRLPPEAGGDLSLPNYVGDPPPAEALTWANLSTLEEAGLVQARTSGASRGRAAPARTEVWVGEAAYAAVDSGFAVGLKWRGRLDRLPARIRWFLAGSRVVLVLGFVATVLQIFGALSPILRELISPRPLATVQIQGQDDNILVGYDSAGVKLWQKDLHSRITKAVVDDLNLDGEAEALAATSQPGEQTGWLFAYDRRGGLVAKHDMWSPSIYPGASKRRSHVVAFEVSDLKDDGSIEIVVISRDAYWFAARLTVLRLENRAFREVATYWNPGYFYLLQIHDVNGDGIQEIVCTVRNNDLRTVLSVEYDVPCALMLTASSISGQAYPWFGVATHGSEVWYLCAMSSEVTINGIDFEDINGDGTEDIHLMLSDTCSYYVGYDGEIIGRGAGSGCRNATELKVIPPLD